jgi:hypothetical protein
MHENSNEKCVKKTVKNAWKKQQKMCEENNKNV